MRCSCGSEWWVEERLIRPAARPSEDPHLHTTASEITYRLVCAECRKAPDAEPAPTPRRGRRSSS